MQSKNVILYVLFALLSVFIITGCSDSGSGNFGNLGNGGITGGGNGSGGNTGGGNTGGGSGSDGNTGGGNTGGGIVSPEPGQAVTQFKNAHGASYAVLANGSLYTWGYNRYGELGLGDTNFRSTPEKVNLNGKVKQIITNYYDGKLSSYALMEDGSLYAWGENSSGKLGLGDIDVRYSPEKVNLDRKVKELITTNNYILFYIIMEDGSLYAWGENGSGKLGLGDIAARYSPEKVNINGKVKQLITYGSSVFSIMEDGSLYAWGYNGGMLGLGDTNDRNTPEKVNINGKVKQLITDGSSVFSIMEDGSLYAWGKNGSGQLGLGDTNERNAPEKVNLNGKVKQIITNYYYYGKLSAYALMEDGSLYAWGNNGSGQLGLGDTNDRNTPEKVSITGSIKELIINGSSIFSLMEDGSLYAWGNNGSGQLGLGDYNDRNKPEKVNLNGKVKQIIRDDPDYVRSLYALMEDGSLYAWGANSDGQLGLGDANDRKTPEKVNFNGKVKQLITNGSSVFSMMEDGSFYAWGYNFYGQLGLGNTNYIINKPEKVSLNGKVKQLITYGFSIFSLMEDGSLYAWGDSTDELGLGDIENTYTPTRVVFNK